MAVTVRVVDTHRKEAMIKDTGVSLALHMAANRLFRNAPKNFGSGRDFSTYV